MSSSQSDSVDRPPLTMSADELPPMIEEDQEDAMPQVTSNVDVIAALRLAEEATESHERFGYIASEILKAAKDTPLGNTGGPALLLRLQREGVLGFRVGVR